MNFAKLLIVLAALVCATPVLAGDALPSFKMYLVDDADGGTIYEYDYESNLILNSFPTPEPADGLFADGLAWAEDRGTLFYTNGNGSGKIYELDCSTGAVLNSFDALAATGGNITNATGLGYGDVLGAGGGAGIWVAGLDTGCMYGIDADAPTGVLEGFCQGGGFLQGPIAAELDGLATWYVMDYYPDIDVFTDQPSPAFVDFYDAPEMDFNGALAGGLATVSMPQPDGTLVQRSYHSLTNSDQIYEYDSSNISAFRPALGFRDDPTPGGQVSAIAAGEADCECDGVPDRGDNCLFDPNPDQTDTDGDLVGDVCDNCPDVANAGQVDSDGNGIGNACEACDPDPRTQGYWHRQCLGVPASEGGIDPGRNGRGPQSPTEPDFKKTVMPAVSVGLGNTIAEFGGSCAAGMDADPPSDPCERAVKQFTALLFNLESGPLQNNCGVNLSAEGCTSTNIGDLVDELASLINSGECNQATACAGAINEGEGLESVFVASTTAPSTAPQTTTLSGSTLGGAAVHEALEIAEPTAERVSGPAASIPMVLSGGSDVVEHPSSHQEAAEDEEEDPLQAIERHLMVLASGSSLPEDLEAATDALLTASSGGYELETRLAVAKALLGRIDVSLYSLLAAHLEDIRSEAEGFDKLDLALEATRLLKGLAPGE